jgi:hypothetical protein
MTCRRSTDCRCRGNFTPSCQPFPVLDFIRQLFEPFASAPVELTLAPVSVIFHSAFSQPRSSQSARPASLSGIPLAPRSWVHPVCLPMLSQGANVNRGKKSIQSRTAGLDHISRAPSWTPKASVINDGSERAAKERKEHLSVPGILSP